MNADEFDPRFAQFKYRSVKDDPEYSRVKRTLLLRDHEKELGDLTERHRKQLHRIDLEIARNERKAKAKALERRRRLRDLHPDRLGREQTEAEREQYTQLSAMRP